jgi:hypothetical protein
MNNIGEKRAFVSNRYPSAAWKRRVDHMADDQVVAVYLSILERMQTEPTETIESDEYEQGRLF